MRTEFYRIFDLEELGEGSRSVELIATKNERELLAQRFEQQSIGDLRANLVLAWLDRGRALSISGNFRAEVVQTCVISLEPVNSIVDEEVDLVFARDTEGLCNIADLDDAEPLEGETLDIGEIVAEELSLAMDPYPRRRDIDLTAIDLGPDVSLVDEDGAKNHAEKRKPFDVLAALRPKL